MHAHLLVMSLKPVVMYCMVFLSTSGYLQTSFFYLTSMVDVIYLDYGQSECVSLNRLCNSTPGDILSRQAMAQYINLEGVRPVSQTTCGLKLLFNPLIPNVKIQIVFCCAHMFLIEEVGRNH